MNCANNQKMSHSHYSPRFTPHYTGDASFINNSKEARTKVEAQTCVSTELSLSP